MARPSILRIDILANARGVGQGVNEADGHLSRLGAGARKAGALVGAGLAIGAVAVGAFAASSVKAASDVEQSFGAVESVFGKAAGQVKGYAEGAATSLGLAKSEYAGLAAVVGSQLQSMGVEQGASAAKTHELIGMGADLAATFGGSVSDAVGAVGSLLRGERDPIEKYGVAIKAADVEARLAATGQDKLTGAALASAQAQATLTLLTEATTNAHGAFGRESNTLAGQQERLRAQFENVKATVGAGLTPVLTKLMTFVTGTAGPAVQKYAGQLATELRPAFDKVSAFVTGTVIPALTKLGTFLKDNQTAVKAVVTVLGVAGAAFATYTTVMGVASAATKAYAAVQAILNAVLKANPIGLVITALVLLGTGLVIAYQKSETFRSVVDGAFRAVKSAANSVGDAIGAIVGKVESVIGAIGRLASKASSVGNVVGKLNPFTGPPLVGAGPQLVGAGPQLVGPGALSRAALGSGGTLSLLAAGGGGGRTTIDNSVRVTIDGALDPVGTARALERVLIDHARRMGRVSTLAGAL